MGHIASFTFVMADWHECFPSRYLFDSEGCYI
jgi:hypothetical protein